MASDVDEGTVLGPADFVHLDVISAFSKLASPNTPQEYVAKLRRQFPFEDNAPADAPRPAIALADYGLQSTAKLAVGPPRPRSTTCVDGPPSRVGRIAAKFHLDGRGA